MGFYILHIEIKEHSFKRVSQFKYFWVDYNSGLRNEDRGVVQNTTSK